MGWARVKPAVRVWVCWGVPIDRYKSRPRQVYRFEPKGPMVEPVATDRKWARVKIFSKYGTLTVVAAMTLVLGVFVPDAQLKKIIFGVALVWFIASVLAKKYGRQTSYYAKSQAFNHGDAEIFEDLKDAFDDNELIEKVPEAVLNYYSDKLKGSEYSFFAAGGKDFPILKMEGWTPNPLEFPQGIFPTLELLENQKNNAVSDSSVLGDMYIAAAKYRGQKIEPNDLYALDKISEVNASGNVVMTVKLSDYEKFVRSSQVLNAELLLHLKHLRPGGNSISASLRKKRFRLKLRDEIKVGEFGNYVCKIGLSVLTVERNIDADRFFIMNRAHMNAVRPLEYPNANHVVPAGTVQPLEDNFHTDESLLLRTTLFREFSEELFKSDVSSYEKLKLEVESANSEVKFIITGMGIDAATQKFEITGLLVLPDGHMSGFTEKAPGEGRNRVVSREELIKCATEVKKIIPAGAMAIFQGLKYLDSIPR